jgi:hypothetical protein
MMHPNVVRGTAHRNLADLRVASPAAAIGSKSSHAVTENFPVSATFGSERITVTSLPLHARPVLRFHYFYHLLKLVSRK